MTDQNRVPALPWPLCRIMQPPGAAAAMAASTGAAGAAAAAGGAAGGRGGRVARRGRTTFSAGGAATPPQVDVVEDRLVVTGAPLESVLAAIESRIGVDVELVRCERTIAGGLGGFFGREQFTVEARPLAGPVAASTGAAADSPAASPAAPASPTGPVDGHAFADALAAALAELDASQIEPVPLVDPGKAVPAGGLQRPTPRTEPESVPSPQAPAVARSSDTVADMLLALLAERADVLDLSQVDHASLDRIADLIAPDPAAAVPVAPAAPVPVPVAGDPAPVAAVPVPVAGDVVPVAAEPEPAAAPVPPSGLRSGSALLAMSAPHMTVAQVVAAVAGITGAAPSLPRAGIVAVVGDADDAVRTAEALAATSGADPGEVLVMSPTPIAGRPSWMCIATVQDAIRRRDRWMQNDRLTFVAVVLTPGADGMNWGCLSLDALAPTQTRLAVPGWRHAEDVEHRLRCLAPVDAIDLVDPTDVVACAGFMDLDVPVGSIGGEPATHEAWADWLRSPRATTSSGHERDDLLDDVALDALALDVAALGDPTRRAPARALDPSCRPRTISAPSFPVVTAATRTVPPAPPRRTAR